MKQKKIVYHLGDIVRIIVPQIFLRCGYPWTKEYVKENVFTEEQKQSIKDLMSKFGYPYLDSFFGNDVLSSKSYGYQNQVYEELADRLAYWVMKDKGFGGRIRSVYTKERLEIKGWSGRVVSKQVVNSGTYDSYHDGDWESPGAYIPYLSNQKSHVILEINLFPPRDDGKIYMYEDTIIKIEEIHVEKIKPSPEILDDEP